MRLIIAITGASGSIYGIRLLEFLKSRQDIETHLVISKTAESVILYETDHKNIEQGPDPFLPPFTDPGPKMRALS